MNRNASPFVLSLAFACSAALSSPTAWGAVSITGHGRYEKIKGKPAVGYVELYESDLFLSPPNSSYVGPSSRLGGAAYYTGSSCQSGTTHDGVYCFENVPAGTYSILVNQPTFFIAPKVVTDVTIPSGQTVTVNPELPIDYSTYFKNDWTGPAYRWYQTFVATGVSIRGVAFSYAGEDPANIEVAVLKDNGNANVVNWQFVGARTDSSIADVTDNWVRWRSGEIPTVIGTRYAIRLTANGGSGNLQPYKRNKDGNSYANGRAYDANGNAQNFDLNITVFSDNDGTVVTMNKRTQGLGYMCDDGFFGTRWGQTFTAKGKGLAGADVFAAGAAEHWDLKFLWRVRQGGPTGPQIGPDKITVGAFYGSGVGLHGVSYSLDEVPLIKNQTYFVEFNVYDPPPDSNGFNPFFMKHPAGASCSTEGDPDQYDGGNAYRGNVARPDDDLSMTILEYAVMGPEIALNKNVLAHNVFLGDSLDSDSFTIFNSGRDTLNYTIDEIPVVNWLDVIPTSGSSTTETDTITVDYSTASLAVGRYTTVIRVSGNAPNSPKDIAVTIDVHSVKPDYDGDTDVDQDDFGHLQECFTGPGVTVTDPNCANAPLDADDDVDIDDFAVLQSCMSGRDIPADRDCAG